MKKIVQNVLLANLLIWFGILSANAQVVPPPTVDAGAINSSNMRNYNNNYSLIETSREKTEEYTSNNNEQPKIGIIEKIQINKIVFSGNTVYSTPNLEKFTKNLVGREATPEEIVKAVQSISGLYRSNGYLTSFAYISSEDFKDGVLEIRVFEGKVGEINISGAKWTRNSYIKNNIFKANKVDKSKIFNVNNLNASIKDLNKTEYLQGQVTIQKGNVPETTDIVLNLKEHLPFSLGTSWNNLGRDLIGVQRANITLKDNNLTGFGDSLSTGVSMAQGTLGVNTAYTVPLGPYGTRLNLGYSFSRVNLGGSYKNLQIQGSSHSFSPNITQPIYKSANLDITSDLSFDMSHSRTNYLKTVKLNGYDIRALRLGLNANKTDRSGMWFSRGAVSTGLPLLGATTQSDYGLGSSKFVKINTDLTRVQYLPFKSVGIFRVSGQFSPDAMLAPEQLQLGGTYTVRGYDEGLALGDLGYNASLEIRRSVPYLKDLNIPYWKGKNFTVPLKDRIQFAAFYDQGIAKTIHQQVPATFLQGIGAGLRINITKYLSANLDLGVPLGRKIVQDQKPVRFHFGISSDVF